MRLIQVTFAFPFRIALPSGFLLGITSGGAPLKVRVHNGDLTQIRKYLRIGEGEGTVPARRIWYRADQVQGSASAPNREVLLADFDVTFVQEVIDHMSYTILDVFFEDRATTMPLAQEDVDRLLGAAMSGARYFVNSYRLEANEADAFEPSDEESPASLIYVADQYTFDDDGVEGEFALVSRQLNFSSPEITGRLKRPLDGANVQRLVSRLRSGEDIALYHELLLEAKTLIHIHRKYHLAIVMCEAAFEVFMQARLGVECRLRGIGELPVGKGRSSRTLDYREALEGGSVREDLLGACASVLLDRSARDCKEYQVWYERCYLPRKEIVHSGRRTVSREQAIKAFEAAIEYANTIDRALTESRPSAC